MAEIKVEVVQAQRALDEAWAALEAHRKQVDAQRVADTDAADQARREAGERVPEVPSWGRRELRLWTAEEDAEYDRLHAAVIAAAQRRREVMQAEGVASTWDTERAVRAAARGDSENG